MSGELGEVLLPELVQMLALGGHTVRVVMYQRSGRVGELRIEGGRVRHCQADEFTGEAAFHHICCTVGWFEVYRDEAGGQDTISCSWQQLLFESARLQDEANRGDAFSAGDLEDLALDEPRERAASVLADLLRDPRTPSAHPVASPVAVPPPARLPRESRRPEDDGFEAIFGEAIYAYLCRELDEAEDLLHRCTELRPDDERVAVNLSRIAQRRRRRGKR